MLTKGWERRPHRNGGRNGAGAHYRRVFATMFVLAAIALLTAASSALAGLQQEYVKFSDCPVENPHTNACVFAQTTSGEFKIGSKTVPITKTITIQGGINNETNELIPAADGNTLSKTPLTLPGGLVGIELDGITEVTATAELAGTAILNAAALNEEKGVAAELPVKIKLSNPALGESCYIGSDAEPVVLRLTTATTNPPPPNAPISGKRGNVEPFRDPGIIYITDNTLVDNAFSAPGVTGCGGPLSLVVDPVVDLDAGLPAEAGHNTAILNGSFAETTPRLVTAEAALPELGRCVKATTTKTGKTTVYHGAYRYSDCIEGGEEFGKFEWAPGPGPNNKFTGTGNASKLETVGGARIKCVALTSAGEWTGAKTATMIARFTGCQLVSSKQACQSSGASGGEIVTSALTGSLGFIKDTFHEGPEVSVGVDFKDGPAIASAECGGPQPTTVTISGSVIAPVTPIDTMATKSTVKAKAAGGVQSAAAFEGGPQDTLVASLQSGSTKTTEQAGLTTTIALIYGEKLEIKGIAE
jgi:hypothetical protein